ncbi:unnamed protein product, partial [Fusarium graminearum]
MTIQLRQGLGDNRNHWLRHAYHAGQRRSDVMLHGQDAVIVRVKIIIKLERDASALKAFIVTLRQSDAEKREQLLSSAVDNNGNVILPELVDEAPPRQTQSSSIGLPSQPAIVSDDELDIANFVSVDDSGETNSFGPSSALYNPAKNSPDKITQCDPAWIENVKNSLIANAALQRHLEYGLMKHPTIAGVPTELAMHLLNLHWDRQHHTFLLTYRPAVMRDLQCSGQYCSTFMLNAIFACCSKFSPRPEVREDPGDPSSAGLRFFNRCDELLAQNSLLMRPHITTIVGLLLLGSTYNARGETSKGWLYTGYALRM